MNNDMIKNFHGIKIPSDFKNGEKVVELFLELH